VPNRNPRRAACYPQGEDPYEVDAAHDEGLSMDDAPPGLSAECLNVWSPADDDDADARALC
jgi:hypothetical protein